MTHLPSPTSWTPSFLLENRERMKRGDLYTAFVPDLIAERRRAGRACAVYNEKATTEGTTRREQVKMLRVMIPSLPELPPQKDDAEEDEGQFSDFPWVEPPFRCDYGSNVSIGTGTLINFGFIAIDTCAITIGSRVLFGPNVQLYSGGHPLDPSIRDGTRGPENGGPITIGDDCWIGGQSIVLPNVTIGRGSTVGAGSVVTRSVPPFVVVAGNPARILKKVESPWATEYFREHPKEE